VQRVCKQLIESVPKIKTTRHVIWNHFAFAKDNVPFLTTAYGAITAAFGQNTSTIEFSTDVFAVS
jgi:hypothetical protein